MANIAKADTTSTYSAILSTLIDTNWIIDTCATDNMVHNMALLNKCSDIPKKPRSKVLLPTGGQVSITKSEESSIFQDRTIHNVLYIQEFKYNMLSVSKITKELSCLDAFFPDFYLFQELFSGKVIGIGREGHGLYILQTNGLASSSHQPVNKGDTCLHHSLVNTITNLSNKPNGDIMNKTCDNTSLWHRILGHAPLRVLKNIDGLKAVKLKDHLCTMCPLAKQSRLPFNLSNTCYAHPFDLEHADVWGPYRLSTYYVYLLNRLPTALLKGKSPFEKLFLRPPSLHNLRVFGSQCYATNVRKTDKFSPRAFPAVHLGYSSSQKVDASLSPPEVVQHIVEIEAPMYEMPPPIQSTDVPSIPASPASPHLSETQYVNYDQLSSAYMDSVAAYYVVFEPRTFAEVSKDPQWVNAMKAVISALEDNKTWSIIVLPPDKVIVNKRGIDYKETFSSVAKMVTVRIVVALAATSSWYIFQMDVHNAFLQGDLVEDVYMQIPNGFSSQGEYKKSHYDYYLFTKRKERELVIILVYVDDLLVTSSHLALIQQVRKDLQNKFKMKNLGELKYFLGIEFSRPEKGIHMCQRKYGLELVSEIGLAGAKPAGTPLEFNHKLTSIEFDRAVNNKEDADDQQLEDKGGYQRIVGRLLYLTMTRPDISFVVQVLSQHMHEPKQSHLEAAMRVIRYIKNVPRLGFFMPTDNTLKLAAYCDSDWGACV
ncbi:uncharacterized protein LOC142179908 [Nicotiana tabacum]|uniref:Uncharacterized protein LOC142179908 n=1 Tax=Nicotiana tabacum TaxID=4097 RepID=A0AC58UBN7_TOBAC